MGGKTGGPIIYLITEGKACAADVISTRSILDKVCLAVEYGLSAVQIREKQLCARDLYEIAVEAARITTGTDTLLLINERFDVALAAGADGVHLPSYGLNAAIVRPLVPRDFFIAVSAHSEQEVENARRDGADMATLGPVFETPGKGPAIGCQLLSEICAKYLGFPIVALGGIDQNNYTSTLDAGAAGFAAIRSLNDRNALDKIAKGVSPGKLR